MNSTRIQLLHQSYTLEITITFPVNGGIRVVSVYCLISQLRSLSAMRAPRQTPHRSMKDTRPTPHWHMRVRIALQRK